MSVVASVSVTMRDNLFKTPLPFSARIWATYREATMSLILIILLILLFAGGGFGYRTWGAMGGGISVGTVLIIILVLYLLGAL